MNLHSLIHAGPFFWIPAVMVAGFFIFRGFSRGIIIAGIDLTGLLLGILTGFIVRALGGWVLGSLFPWSPFFTGIGLGVAAALGIFMLTAYFAPLIYECIDEVASDVIFDRGDLIIQTIFTVGGALVELVVGMILIGSIVAVLIACGNEAIRELQVANGPPNWVETTLVQIRDDLDSASRQGMADLSQKLCQPVAKLVKVSRDPEAMARLDKYPEIQKLMADPQIAPLLASPKVQDDVAKNDYMTLVQDPLLHDVAAHFGLVENLCSAKTNQALDELLGPAQTAKPH